MIYVCSVTVCRLVNSLNTYVIHIYIESYNLKYAVWKTSIIINI